METLLTTAGNLVTISSRSFGVADKIKSGRAWLVR